MADTKTITFTGITSIKGVDYTLRPGVQPSSGTLSVARQNITTEVGNLNINYVRDLSTLANITLTDCRLDRATIQTASNGVDLDIQFLDRRHRWKFGHIDGRYNILKDDGTIEREKTPQELATILLEAMGETGYDASGLSTVSAARPYVNWRADVPATMLDSLLRDLGFYVVLKLNNTVVLEEAGTGGSLPVGMAIRSLSYSVNLGQVPATIRVATAPIEFETKFLLEAVGEDTDGSIKPINDLSYKPAGGWEDHGWPEWPNVTGTFTREGQTIPRRDLARKCIYRWYRVKSVVGGPGAFAPPGFPGTSGDIDRIEYLLPIKPYRNSEVLTIDGQVRREKAVVTGLFYKEDGLDDNTLPHTVYPYGFSIDGDTGIVKFSKSVFFRTQDRAGTPLLYLQAVVQVTDPDTGIKFYWADEVNTGSGFGVRTIDQPELVRRITANYEGAALNSTDDNLTQLQAYTAVYAAAEIERLSAKTGAVLEVAGIEAIDNDGIIREVRWAVAQGRPSVTTVSTSTEANPYVPDVDTLQAQSEQSKRTRLAKVQAAEAVIASVSIAPVQA